TLHQFALLLAVQVATIQVEGERQCALLLVGQVHCEPARTLDAEAVCDLLAVVAVDDRALLVYDDRHLHAVLADGLLKGRILVIGQAGKELVQH
ncbi:MAG: hypothetical protein Q4F67_17715, partial [Propionibacteriaceae bacterium]|nr:hypothetical protein [Propionibacteriaceae bacterium]